MKTDLKKIVKGAYVMTPIKNAFNQKTAYWISKDGCTLALYMFTVENCLGKKDLESRFSDDNLKPFIAMFEERLKRKPDPDVLREEMEKLEG